VGVESIVQVNTNHFSDAIHVLSVMGDFAAGNA